MANKKEKDSDIHGITRLAKEATLGVTDLVEDMHKRVVHPPRLPSTPIQKLVTKIAGFTYKNIKRSTHFVGDNLDLAISYLTPLLKKIKTNKDREALRAALNGVVGDYLERKDNPLQIEMQFRHEGQTLPMDKKALKEHLPNLNGKLLLMLHGLCMNDVQLTRKNHNHAKALAKAFNMTPIFLYYNSGRHISTNGQEFNRLLDKLVQSWPVPIEELTIVGHSMGGLVTRSAIHYGEQQHISWLKYLKQLVFLGTPHHGAPLEQAGNYVDIVLESIPYSKPFARLGKIRSAGVTDLRHGNLLDEDWQEEDRFEKQKDHRAFVPALPEHIKCFSIAAVLGKKKDYVSHKVIGDGLVTVKSALGQHENPDKHLHFKAENTWIKYETSHLDLLNDTAVYEKLRSWLR